MQSDLFLFILGIPLEVILDLPMEDSFLENMLTNDVDKKSLLMMFSTITLSFTVIFTTLLLEYSNQIKIIYKTY